MIGASIGGMTAPKRHLRELYELFASVDTSEEAEELLEDILTPQERDSLAERWQLIKMLDEGIPQREIAKRLGISISKITRGSRMMKYGSGGFRRFLRRRAK